MNDLPTAFGKYYLTEKLAVGGMAEIYLAKLIGPGGFEKQLIIKQIHPELSDQPQFVDLFVHEAKTLVSLTHGNIVPIYELGVVEDRYFIAMEYIDGPTLSQLQTAVAKAGTRIAPHIAAYIAAELLKGLDYAHRRGDGVIHRDLSPRNVMISREGEVKLVDFGIAVGLEQQNAREGRPEGSFPYMSPEQVRGESLTARSDLFAAGVLLWETLTGTPLFLREGADDTLRAVLEADIPAPSEAAPDAGIPDALDQICARALSRDAAERFVTAGDFSSKLYRYLYSQEEPISPTMLSRLVARHCPPVVRRRVDTESPAPLTPVRSEDGVDRTVPHPRGKHRAGTQTFATNVAFETQVLAKATPLFPIQAITDEQVEAMKKAGATDPAPAPAPTPPPASPSSKPGAAPDARADALGATAPSDTSDGTLAIPRQRPTPLVPILAVLVLIAGATAAFFALRGRGATAAPPPDAAIAIAVPFDAAIPDAAVPDAAAADAAAADARPAVRKRTDAAPVVRGEANLKVGANPWAEVYLDRKKLGVAPGQWTIPAGTHTVRLHYPHAKGDPDKIFRITVRDGETKDLGVTDFTDR